MKNLVSRKFRVTLLAAFSLIALLIVVQVGVDAAGVDNPQKKETINGREVVSGEVLVKFHERSVPSSIDRARKNADVNVDKNVGGKGARPPLA